MDRHTQHMAREFKDLNGVCYVRKRRDQDGNWDGEDWGGFAFEEGNAWGYVGLYIQKDTPTWNDDGDECVTIQECYDKNYEFCRNICEGLGWDSLRITIKSEC